MEEDGITIMRLRSFTPPGPRSRNPFTKKNASEIEVGPHLGAFDLPACCSHVVLAKQIPVASVNPLYCQIMMTQAHILVMADAAPAGNTTDMLRTLGPLGIMIFVFYFLLIRPQQKKAKEHENLLKTLKAGDKVSTTSGIIGVIVSVKDKSVTLRSSDAKFELLKSAVTEIIEREGETTEKQN